MAKDQFVIHGVNSHQKKRQSRRQGRCFLLFAFVAALLFATVVVTQVASTNHFNAHTNNGGITGAQAMLNNFVETREQPTDDGISSTKINDKTLIHENEDKVNDNGQQQPLPIDRLIDRSHRIEIPDENRTLAFVHVGKSGGSTISLLLRNGCISAADGTPCEPPDRWRKIPGQIEETIASERIKFYLHTPHVNSGKIAEYYRRVSSVVVVARDPLDRFVSAFLSQHPRNIEATRRRNFGERAKAEAKGLEPPIWAKPVWSVSGDRELDQIYQAAYTGCYPTPDKFARCADPSPREPVVDRVYKTKISWMKNGPKERDIILKCREICRDVVSGKSQYILHLRFNYEAFLQDLPPETEVLVIRTKKLWHDWIDVNDMLGAKESVYIPDEGTDGDRVNAAQKLPVRNKLRPRGRKIICQFLTNEIQIYINLLNRAVNLSDDDVRTALEEVQANCPSVFKYLQDRVYP